MFSALSSFIRGPSTALLTQALGTASSRGSLLRSAQQQTPSLASQTRGSKHPSYGGKKLPGYLLPHQSEKTAHLKQHLKMKWHRLKVGKAGQRPRRPRYGRDDFILSKLNM